MSVYKTNISLEILLNLLSSKKAAEIKSKSNTILAADKVEP
jgi:hypothetical protein